MATFSLLFPVCLFWHSLSMSQLPRLSVDWVRRESFLSEMDSVISWRGEVSDALAELATLPLFSTPPPASSSTDCCCSSRESRRSLWSPFHRRRMRLREEFRWCRYMTQLAIYQAEICCHTFQKSVLTLIVGVLYIFFHIRISKK